MAHLIFFLDHPVLLFLYYYLISKYLRCSLPYVLVYGFVFSISITPSIKMLNGIPFFLFNKWLNRLGGWIYIEAEAFHFKYVFLSSHKYNNPLCHFPHNPYPQPQWCHASSIGIMHSNNGARLSCFAKFMEMNVIKRCTS